MSKLPASWLVVIRAALSPLAKASPGRLSIISSATGLMRKALPIRYLGVPLFVGVPKPSYFPSFLDRMHSPISSWRSHFLSKGGRIVLLQSVLCSMPFYTLSVITPPAGFIAQMNRLCANVFWGSSEVHSTTGLDGRSCLNLSLKVGLSPMSALPFVKRCCGFCIRRTK